MDGGQAGDAVAAILRGDLEERSLVDDKPQQPPGIEHLSPVPRNDRQQFVVHTVGVVAGVAARCHLEHAARQVAEKSADLREGIRLGVSKIVDAAAFSYVNLLAAEVLLGDVI